MTKKVGNRVFSEAGESIFSIVTRYAKDHDAINLGQGFPNFSPPEQLLSKLEKYATNSPEYHQYAPSPGLIELRRAISELYDTVYGLSVDPVDEITVTTGATEALASIFLGLVNQGDEVIVFEPVYDLYDPMARRAGASVKSIPLTIPDFDIPISRVRNAIRDKTKFIVLNNPHNPTGRIFPPETLIQLLDLANDHDLRIICDEVYEHLYFHDEYNPIGTLTENDRDRIIWVSSAGKMLDATAWKLGWVIASPRHTRAIRRSHQYTTFCTSTFIQKALAEYLDEFRAEDYFRSFRREYSDRLEVLLEALGESPFSPLEPDGTYYCPALLESSSQIDTRENDLEFVKWMMRSIGVAAIPLSSFYVNATPDEVILRFAFCKRTELLKEAGERLVTL